MEAPLGNHVSDDHEGNIACPRCHLLFDNRASCNLHAVHEHVEITATGRVQCIFCPSTSVNLQSLRSHYWYAHNTTRSVHVCKICDMEFTWKKPLAEHLALHTEQKIKCPTCPRTFISLRFLNQHKKLYADETPEGLLPCYACGKLFKNVTDCRRHEVQIHFAPDVYPCTHPGCSVACPTARALESHLKSHKTERPFKCPHCVRWFKEEVQLKRHTTSLHPVDRPGPNPDKPFQCPSCVRSFKKAAPLAQHVKNYHSEDNTKWVKRLEKKE